MASVYRETEPFLCSEWHKKSAFLAPSETVQQFKFHSRFRKSEETVARFVSELRSLAKFCNFGAMLEDMLRDRLVCGISDVQIQRRLLAERTLTFTKALEIAQGLETAAKNMRE